MSIASPLEREKDLRGAKNHVQPPKSSGRLQLLHPLDCERDSLLDHRCVVAAGWDGFECDILAYSFEPGGEAFGRAQGTTLSSRVWKRKSGTEIRSG